MFVLETFYPKAAIRWLGVVAALGMSASQAQAAALTGYGSAPPRISAFAGAQLIIGLDGPARHQPVLGLTIAPMAVAVEGGAHPNVTRHLGTGFSFAMRRNSVRFGPDALATDTPSRNGRANGMSQLGTAAVVAGGALLVAGLVVAAQTAEGNRNSD
jgi:hypothetical protein